MRLTKHHGLGNDFLVLLDLDGIRPVSPQDAVALCDRRRGIGADGLMRVTAGTDGADGADVTMRLLNADGSVAEMSGNAIRCLAQAVFQAGLATPPLLRVATDAGLRTVPVPSRPAAHAHSISEETAPHKDGAKLPDGAGGDTLRKRQDVGEGKGG